MQGTGPDRPLLSDLAALPGVKKIRLPYVGVIYNSSSST